MDPLSISVSTVTLIQITSEVVSLCFNYATAAKSATRSILEVLDQLKNLRNVLESLEHFSRGDEDANPAINSQTKTILELCNAEEGPIAKELKYLDDKLRPPEWASREGSRRKALVQSLTWPLKEGETKKTLQNIERLKSNLALALSVYQTTSNSLYRETEKLHFESLDNSLKLLRDGM